MYLVCSMPSFPLGELAVGKENESLNLQYVPLPSYDSKLHLFCDLNLSGFHPDRALHVIFINTSFLQATEFMANMDPSVNPYH